MRIVLEPTTDGRWQIWGSWPEEWSEIPGAWICTVAQAELGRRVQQLVVDEAAARLRGTRRRTKGAGG